MESLNSLTVNTQILPSDRGLSPKIGTNGQSDFSERTIRNNFETLKNVEVVLSLDDNPEESEENRKKQNKLFDGYISLNADGIDLNGISQFKQTIGSSWNTVRHIAWYDLIINQYKYEKSITKLRKAGYIVTYFEDVKKLDDMPHYTLCLTSNTIVKNILPIIECDGYDTPKYIGMLLYAEPNTKHLFDLTANKYILGVYDNFEEIYKYIIMMSNFYSHIYYENQIFNSFGLTFDMYHPTSCCCNEHLKAIVPKRKESLKTLETFLKSSTLN